MICQICNSQMSEPNEQLFSLPSVTSDCRPWGNGRSVCVCSGCGVMRRVVKEGALFHKVYDDYINYPEPNGRTKKILDFVKDKVSKPKSILDIGCGNGDGLLALKDVFPKSSVSGYDPYNILWSSRPSEKFEFITLFHVLEHVDDLDEMFSYIKSSLSDKGHLLIQVPIAALWPFDLVIADHFWHFDSHSLYNLLIRNGFKIVSLNNNCITKELTALAVLDDGGSKDLCSEGEYLLPVNWILNYKKFLDSVDEEVVVFGTGPAAAWAGNILGDKVKFYIDDDISRCTSFNKKSVWHLSQIDDYCPRIVAPFSDWQMPAIKSKHKELRFL